MTFFYFLQARRALDFGMSRSSASSLVYGFGLGQAVGRTLGGVSMDHIKMNRLAMSSLTLFLCGVATIVSIYLRSYVGKSAFSSNRSRTIYYGIKCKAAINSLPFNLHCKAIAALFFILYCRPI